MEVDFERKIDVGVNNDFEEDVVDVGVGLIVEYVKDDVVVEYVVVGDDDFDDGDVEVDVVVVVECGYDVVSLKN